MLKKSGKPNQQLIAKTLNISRTTVSRCFTHHPKINPETRAKVFQLAKEIGYKYSAPRNPSLSAEQAQPTRVEVIIGVSEARRVHMETSKNVFEGIIEKAASEKIQVGLNYVDPATFEPKQRSRKMLSGIRFRDIKGIVLIYAFQEQTVQNLMGRLPVVSVFEDYDQVNVDCVNPDQNRGISCMVDHLVELGHRRIGFSSWNYDVAAPWAERRFGAFVESLYRSNLDFEPKDVVNMRRDETESPEDVVDRVEERIKEGVTAWVCAADHQAYHLVEHLQNRGYKVPGDISITGFDGIDTPEGLPKVTTYNVPFREMGISSIIALIRRGLHPTDARRQVMVEGNFVAGETTARPRCVS